ncbi:MAG: cytochrome c peroxidase [Bacteroidota bacterium]
MLKKTIFFLLLVIITFNCKDKTPGETPIVGDLTGIPYNPTPHSLIRPEAFPSMLIPNDNPMTEEGIELGRYLFYDPILSADNTMSCSSCHLPNLGFADGKKVSFGIDGVAGLRSAMSLVNIGYVEKGLFWDGKVNTLEEQALLPIEDPLELHDTWENVERKLKEHADYPTMFREAFGIGDTDDITRDLAVKAIAQFERTLISHNSRYDIVKLREEGIFTDSEERGFRMFFDSTSSQGLALPDAECGHCHNAPLMTTDEYFNNGLDSVGSLTDYFEMDAGLGLVTQDTFDNGKFRAPSLRNIALTAPYMHDGRFQTLEEVVDFYNESPHHAHAPNVDANIRPLGLTESQKEDIINFLHTLTDTVFTQNPRFQSPF